MAAEHDDVAGVWVGVEKTILKGHLDDDPDGVASDALAIIAGGDGLGQLLAVEKLQAEDAPRRGQAVDAGEADMRVAGEVFAEALGVLGLLPEIELGEDGALELLHHAHRVENAQLLDRAVDDLGQDVKQLEVAFDGAFDAGALHLDHHLALLPGPLGVLSVGLGFVEFGGEAGAMDLADRRGGQRRVIEADKNLADGATERRFDFAPHRIEFDRRHVVL